MSEEVNTPTTEPETGAAIAPDAATTPLVFDTWAKNQPEEIQGMLTARFSRLENALTSERDSRKELEKQMREAAQKAGKDPETQAQLTKLADEMSETNRKAEFYEAAHAAGVVNLKLAYLAATQDGLFDKRGVVNFEAIKQSYPELFGVRKPPAANPGDGTGTQPPASKSMNDFIRTAAGRK